MLRATLNSRGQVTMPASIRRAVGLEPGDQVLFLVEGRRLTLIPVPTRRLTELKGALASSASVSTPAGDEAREAAARTLGESMAEEMGDWREHSWASRPRPCCRACRRPLPAPGAAL